MLRNQKNQPIKLQAYHLLQLQKQLLQVQVLDQEKLWHYLLQLALLMERRSLKNALPATVLLKVVVIKLVQLYGVFWVDKLVQFLTINILKQWLHMEKNGHLRKLIVF
uniref:Uncharacterized protein n=1 Tax=uncultured marine bacterium HF4000_APKG3108 TaxID=455615 RepID=B3TCV0_9BACT|nr:hypothetical protein ALOHA_HF4000APKG3108ctg1g20 [uncultured marine bacterium HF4000_APKG3108]